MSVQLPLVVLGLLAAAGVTSANQRLRLLGSVFGLLSQPFWLYATYTAGQWGMFTLAFVYVGLWSRGIYVNRATNRP